MPKPQKPLASLFVDERAGRVLTATELDSVNGAFSSDTPTVCANDWVTDRPDGTSTYDIDGFRVDD